MMPISIYTSSVAHHPPHFFPYTTLFRSDAGDVPRQADHARRVDAPPHRSRRRGADDPGHRRDLGGQDRSEEHTSELQSRRDLVCRLLLEKKKATNSRIYGALTW